MFGIAANRIVLFGPNADALTPPQIDPTSCPIFRMLAKINQLSIRQIILF